MVINYYQKHEERHWKKARERYQNLSEEEKDKYEKRLVKDIEILVKKKEEKDINVIWNVKRSYLAIEEIII